MPHFFVNSNSIENNTAVIEDAELLTHLVKALRIKLGEKISLFDENKMSYEAIIKELSIKRVTAEIVSRFKSERTLDLNIFPACSILKQDAFNELISGMTQLGIKKLYPIYTDNTVPAKSIIEGKTIKWQKISDEAVKQCERADFMKIMPTQSIEEIDYSCFDKVIVFSEIEKKLSLKQSLLNVNPSDKILVIIGPEGGFSKEEFIFFKNKKFIQVKISSLILKAQTAAIAGISNIIYELNQ